MIQSLGKYFLTVIGAAYFALFVNIITLTPFRMIFDPIVSDVASSLCCTLASVALLFFLTRKYGYNENKPEKT